MSEASRTVPTSRSTLIDEVLRYKYRRRRLHQEMGKKSRRHRNKKKKNNREIQPSVPPLVSEAGLAMESVLHQWRNIDGCQAAKRRQAVKDGGYRASISCSICTRLFVKRSMKTLHSIVRLHYKVAHGVELPRTHNNVIQKRCVVGNTSPALHTQALREAGYS